MKTRTGPKRSDTGRTPAVRKDHDETIAVLVDTVTEDEVYMFLIDSFEKEGRSYAVMVPYEPDEERNRDPEIVILRSLRGRSGEQLYATIRKRRELDLAFSEFVHRFETAEGP